MKTWLADILGYDPRNFKNRKKKEEKQTEKKNEKNSIDTSVTVRSNKTTRTQK